MEYGFILRWIVVYAGLWVLALPLAAALFRRFPDSGSGLSVPLALTTLGFSGYWIGRVVFGLSTALVGVVILSLLSGFALYKGVEVDWNRATEPMAVFAVAFVFMLAIRAVDPGAFPGGGEKFLDLGLLSSLVRGRTLPPQDMWFAGEPVNYYYGGHMIAALLAELTATPPKYAYNLALPGFYAALVTAAYSVGGAVSAQFERSHLVGGGFAAAFVGIASNLGTPLRALAWLLPGGRSVAEILGFATGRYGNESLAYGPTGFSYWDASGGMVSGINEFPFFAFLNGDLHAHMMSTPFLLLTVGLLLSYWQTATESRGRRRLLLFGSVPIVGGLLGVINTWSFPTVAGLTWLTLIFAPGHPADLLPASLRNRLHGRERGHWVDRELDRSLVAFGVAVVVAAVGAVLVAPFFAAMVLGSPGSRHLAVLPDRAGFVGLLLVHGAFLAIGVVYLLRRTGVPDRPLRLSLMLLLAVLLAALADAAVVGLVIPLLVVAWVIGRNRDDVGFEVVLFMGALGLITLVEFVFIEEQAGPGRMNTVFKTYMQIWVLLATAAGAMVADVARFERMVADFDADLRRTASWVRRDRSATSSGDGSAAVFPVRFVRGSRFVSRENAGAILGAILIVSVSIYGGIALATHFGGGRPDATLDATAYVEERHPGEAAGIEWIDGVDGQPTLVTAPGTDIYQWRNAPSSLTGVPTVAGWRHEIGYRGGEAYWERVDHVDAIYTGSRERQVRLLQRYDVEYVYVGPVERDRYGTDIDVGEISGVTRVAGISGSVTIYRVDRSELSG